jgi:hypothetical protein
MGLEGFFIGLDYGRRLPATYCTLYYGFKGMKEEQGLLIQQKNLWLQQGLNP